MNVFLPYINDIEKSVQSLDSSRLIKQIQETKVLFDGARAYEKGQVPNSYFRHPVAQHYKDEPEFLACYGFQCCKEYWFRYNKYHQYYDFFEYLCEDYYKTDIQTVAYTPYYMEGSKNTPECIRTTEEDAVGKLFQAKLINKWINDKKTPNWNFRGMPKFYEDYLELDDNHKLFYWKLIEELKKEVRNG